MSMRYSQIALAVLAALLVLFGPPGALQAQTCDAARARESFSEGLALLRDHRYADAIPVLQRSIEQCERPVSWFNLGLALRGTRQCRGAFRAFSRAAALETDPTARVDADTNAQEMRACIVSVTLAVRGLGTDDTSSAALVDGRVASTRDSTTTIELDPGRHVFEARRRGYQPVHQERVLQPGERARVELDASAQAVPATITVDVDTSDATVLLDGQPAQSGRELTPVSPGSHELEVRFSSSDVQRRTVECVPGGRFVVTFRASDRPLYTRWWIWTIVGTVVVGGAVVGGVMLFSREADPYLGTWDHGQAISVSR